TGINSTLADPRTLLTWDDLASVPAADYEVFEPVSTGEIDVLAGNSRIYFYTWGQKECCLERGSTSATLLDAWVAGGARRLMLKEGSVLIFEEVLGPHTGLSGDADPSRRQAVRLTKVAAGEDAVIGDGQGRPT